ncbi:MAG: DeoR/GlpR family DNA-binding transcription regulator [Halanaerobiales bacterium]|nr:DeoR/GlpR family DNA-binding transcription regulator [Halanaerobiales bacterium]
MLKEERKAVIKKHLEENKIVKTSDLSLRLNVSEATVRRYLKELEEEKNITRVHGGATLGGSASPQPSYDVRKEKHLKEKQMIAKLAFSFIKNEEVIFLDAGTTVYQIAELIRENESDFSQLSVITNSIVNAYTLSSSGVNLKVLGGDLRKDTLALVGRETENALNQLWVNKLFLAASGVNLEHGITSTDIFQADLKNKLIQIAQEVILVVDSSKLNKMALNRVANIDIIDILITDDQADQEFLAKIKKNDIKVYIAEK